MRERLGLCAILMFSLLGLCLGRFVVEKNSLKVTSPEFLKNTYECAIGNFGVPQYGGAMAGQVVYPTANRKSCLNFDDFGISFRQFPGALPIFVLVDRRDCLFILKTWNAQVAGAAAVLVADDTDGPLVTMDTPEEEGVDTPYLANITIPSVLISRSLANNIKEVLLNKGNVSINLDWSEALPHPDNRVEYEFWTNSNDECGQKCSSQLEFIKEFKGAAQILERGGYTQFTPHYMTWYCPEDYLSTKQCKSQCTNGGRYCAPDPDLNISVGYEGKDVVVENLRQICFHKVSNESKKPWLWWDYVTDFAIRCPMKEKRYNKGCADTIIRSLGIDLKKIDECMGDPKADADNQVLKSQQDAQVGSGSRGDVTMLPTLVINNRQYRGKLSRRAVLKAICAGFQESTEPAICLTEGGIETNECLENNGGCWEDKDANITACKDTFRGRKCKCPVVNGVQLLGDGYTHCEVPNSLSCEINNGYCWKGSQDGKTYSACLVHSSNLTKACICPPGFKGDGVHSCEDVDECVEKTACQCPDCRCKNTWGSFECSCASKRFYVPQVDSCIGVSTETKSNWTLIWMLLLGLGAAGLIGYAVYKYRFRRYMDAEIRSLMSQYMPLNSQQDEI
ncbi:unnamed protein product [Rhodiola kirilowii]